MDGMMRSEREQRKREMQPQDWFFLRVLKLAASVLGRKLPSQPALMSTVSCIPYYPKGRCPAKVCGSGSIHIFLVFSWFLSLISHSLFQISTVSSIRAKTQIS